MKAKANVEIKQDKNKNSLIQKEKNFLKSVQSSHRDRNEEL
jgi:hypothetical protein